MAEAYKLVAFDDISKTYAAGADVECTYTIKHPLQPSKYDWIGLFRVPWSSVKDKVYYHYVSMLSSWKEESDKHGNVVFQAASLPGDDGEYYQFVYFDGKSHMRGASSPFTFRQSHNFDLVEEVMSEDSDMLFITTRQTQLETQITELQTKYDHLQQQYLGLEARNRDLLGQTEDLEEQLEGEHNRKTQSDNQLKVIEAELKEYSTEKGAAVKRVKELEAELETVRAKLERITGEKEGLLQQITSLRNEADVLIGEVSALRREKEMYMQHATQSDANTQRVQEQMEDLQRKLEHHKYTSDDIEALEIQVCTAKAELEKNEEVIAKQEELMETLRDQVNKADTRHQLNVEEMSTLRETLDNLSGKYEELSHLNDDLKQRYSKSKEDVATLQEEKKEWEMTLEQKSKEVNKLLSDIAAKNISLFQASKEVETKRMEEQRFSALSASYQMVKDELSSVKKNLEDKTKQEKQIRNSERLATKRVDELQQKLKAGEKEWKKVSKRNAELERKLVQNSRDNPIFGAFRRSQSTASDEPTRDELQQIVAEQTGDIEELRQKKDRYRQKYLDEKQRIATIKDNHRLETNRLTTDLAAARRAVNARVVPTPDVAPSSQDCLLQYPGIGDSVPSSGGDAMLLGRPLLGDNIFGREGSDSDEDDNMADRFHDAVEIGLDEKAPESCCFCHSQFDSSDDVQKKTEHVNTHLQSFNPVDPFNYKCPMCEQLFDKTEFTDEQFQSHVLTHFPEDN